MVDRTPPAVPLYRDLPDVPGGEEPCAWGVFGNDDRIGALNRIDERAVQSAARLITSGKIFPLNWRLDRPAPPLLSRLPLRHTLLAQDVGFDDRYDSFYPQASSQWDALCHVAHPVHGFYNGLRREDVDGTRGNELSIDRWGQRGIAGRFVLVDLARSRARRSHSVDCGSRHVADVGELHTTLEEHDISLQEGDILLLRFGWISWYESLNEDERIELAQADMFPAPGIEAVEETAQWLWDSGVAAVCSDTPALEAMPFDKSDVDGFLHFRLIPLLGMAVGELFDLEKLATDCAGDGRYAGFITAAPFNLPGGSGSPANALAVK